MSPFWRKRSNDFIVAVIFAALIFLFNIVFSGDLFLSLLMSGIAFVALVVVAPIIGMIVASVVDLFRQKS